MTTLKGKTALITGSTSGIGLGVATALAGAGANIIINGFGDEKDIEATRKKLEKMGGKALYNGADMTRPDEIRSMFDQAERALGGVDILVNNAGIQFVSPIEDFPEAKWDAILAINLSAAFHTIKAAVPVMKKKKWGRIVNIASAHALVASPYKSAYVAAKHGLLGLTRTVALETAQSGITCNAICPGYVKTPLVEGQIKDQAKSRGISEEEVVNNVILGAQPSKQFTTVEQIGDLVLFLCGEGGKNMTGAPLTLDGGWTAQ